MYELVLCHDLICLNWQYISSKLLSSSLALQKVQDYQHLSSKQKLMPKNTKVCCSKNRAAEIHCLSESSGAKPAVHTLNSCTSYPVTTGNPRAHKKVCNGSTWYHQKTPIVGTRAFGDLHKATDLLLTASFGLGTIYTLIGCHLGEVEA